MAGFTNFYHIAFFDFGDDLSAPVNVQLEIDRFVFIDKQIYGLYQVFGDGVVDGWNIFDNGYNATAGISIGVSAGSGIIKSIAAETNLPQQINSIPSNSQFDVYAVLSGNTVDNRSVQFVLNIPGADIGDSAVKIGNIITGVNGIALINNNTRSLVGMTQNIQDAINAHKHRGGITNPSKIDLTAEVKGQLPGARIDGFDASKIVSGRLTSNRIPSLSHMNLKDIGNLTHAQLESLLQLLPTDNRVLLGEISTINLLKQIIFLKSQYHNIDEYFVNELSIIPGISSDSLIDYDDSTAHIDGTLSMGCIVGLPLLDDLSYFYTNNFTLPDKVKNVFLISHKSVPTDSEIIFGVNTTNSLNFNDYTVLTENAITPVIGIDNFLRVGIKFYNPNPIIFDPYADPYTTIFTNYVDFQFINQSVTKRFHFRIRFYTDPSCTNLYLTEFSANSQEDWIVDDAGTNYSISSCGYEVGPMGDILVTFYTNSSKFVQNNIYYIIIDVWDGTSFLSQSAPYEFMATGGTDFCSQYGNYPLVKNFALLFEMENNRTVMLNL
jgi:hypothetical protein